MADVKPDLPKRKLRLVAVYPPGAPAHRRPATCMTHEQAAALVRAGDAEFINRAKGIRLLVRRKAA